MTDAFDRVTYHGKTMDKKTMAFLKEAEKRLGYDLTIYQGSYSNSVGASAGTHGGGGVVDLAPFDSNRKVHVLRALGAFAWYRPARAGVWPAHIHMGIRNHGNLSPEARHQQDEYDAHPPLDGLAGTTVDPTWHPDPPVTFKYPVVEEKPPVEKTHVEKATAALDKAILNLSTAILELKEAVDRPAAKAQIDDIQAARKQVRLIQEKLPDK